MKRAPVLRFLFTQLIYISISIHQYGLAWAPNSLITGRYGCKRQISDALSSSISDHSMMLRHRERLDDLEWRLPSSRGGSDLNDHPTPLKRISKFVIPMATLTFFVILAVKNKDSIIKLNLKGMLAEKLDKLANLGTPGLVIYALSFWAWEIIFGVTAPVETAAGMAFGLKNGIIVNAIGKTSGAITAFLIGRYVLIDYVNAKLKGNEYMDLIKHSITSNPILVAIIWRFSFLPEFMKNFGLSVLPLKTWQFAVAVFLHGFPFTVLWTFIGKEMGLVLRGVLMKPSKILKFLVGGVYVFGFLISPTLVGLWIKGLKDEQKKRQDGVYSK